MADTTEVPRDVLGDAFAAVLQARLSWPQAEACAADVLDYLRRQGFVVFREYHPDEVPNALDRVRQRIVNTVDPAQPGNVVKADVLALLRAASQTDRQPPASASATKGGKGLEGPADA